MSRSESLRKLIAAAGVAIPALYYLLNMAPSLTWLDSGELIATSWVLGTSHPPGHPLYMVASKMLGYVLPGGVAFRYNLVSLIFAVAALAAAGRMFREILTFVFRKQDDATGSFGLTTELCASAGVMALAFCPPFGIQAMRAEVYTLAFAMAVLLIWASLRVFMTGGAERRRMLVPIVFLMGLGLSIHNLTVILLSPCAAIALAVIGADMLRNREGASREVLAAAAAFLLSLLPFLHLLLVSRSGSYLDYSHVGSVREFFDVFFASAYRESFVEEGHPFSLRGNLGLFWDATGIQVIPAMFVLAAAGAFAVARRSRLLTLAVLAGIFFPVLGVVTQQKIYPQNIDHGAYVVPSLLLVVLLAFSALRYLGELPLIARHFGGRPAAGRTFTVALALALAGSQLLSETERLSMKNSTTASAHADLLDLILPPDAFLFLNNDEVSFPLLYMQTAEGRRLDVVPGARLQLTRPNGYAVARAYWPDRLPPESEIWTGSDGDPDSVDAKFLKALLRNAENRWPVLWDHTGEGAHDQDPGLMLPYYHLAVIAPAGMEALRSRWRGKGDAFALTSRFHDFFELSAAFSITDAFAYWRLARWPLLGTSVLYFRSGDRTGCEIVNALALEYVPDDAFLLYSQGIAMELRGAYESSLFFYKMALEGGYDEVEIEKAVKRVRALAAGVAKGSREP